VPPVASRQVAIFKKEQRSPNEVFEAMKPRIGTVEPVSGTIRHNKRLNRFTLRGSKKVGTPWRVYCQVHNIEELAGSDLKK
jgi:hypothetical protein